MAFAQTIEFRFKLPEISSTTPLSQSLLVNRTGSTNTSTQFGVYLEYTGSLSSGSYSGSIVDPYYQYGNLKFIHPDAGVSASIYLPFFNGDWWSVMVTKKDDPYVTYDLYAASKTLNEYGQYVVQYQGSSSLQTPFDWKKPGNVLIPGSGSSTILGKIYVPATGSFQELRYYNVPLSESQFNDYVVNSNSIEGNTLDSSYDELFFRAALGGELFTGSTSIHPAVNTTPSFDSGNSNFSYTGSYAFNSNTEIHYYDQVPAGIQNPVSQKIKQQNIVLPYSSSNVNVPNSNVLSPFISVQQSPSISQSYTRDIDYVEVAFSPQNEINDDINDELGYFNVGELIGDPRFQSSSLEYYPDLNALSNSYFKKYDSNYDWNDYVRLIKFFDNSLFKMLADWIPARASLASGVVIKNTLLDRNRYRTPQVTTSSSLANIGSGSTNIPYIVEDQTITGSIDVGNIEGGNGGSMPDLLGLTSSLFTYPGAVNVVQVWDGSTPSLSGSVSFTESSQTEFYDGELSGSNLVVTDGDLTENLDYLVIENDIQVSRPSSKYLDVDFTDNYITAVNEQAILSGSATKATVPDSNYTSLKSANPRYFGCENDEIDEYAKYFAYFDWIGGSNPQYPGGGNIHIINLVDVEGNVITLTPENKNLFNVEQIFKPGDPVYAYQVNNTSVTPFPLPELNIVRGGGFLDTIVFKSGSASQNGYATNFSTFSPNYSTASFVEPLVGILTDSGSSNSIGWLYPLLTGSSPSVGNLVDFQYFISPSPSATNVNFINRFTLTTPSGDPNNSFQVNFTINESYLPLKEYDYIRFGTTSNTNMDQTFIGEGLFQIKKINIGADYNFSSSLEVYPNYYQSVPSNLLTQNWRIMRMVPNETFVLVSALPTYRGGGLLVPYNFNPNFDPYTLAKKAGLV
jgi:hypothetical protein